MSLTRQLVVVTAADWSANCGWLRCFERAQPALPWQAFAAPVPVMLGRGGLAWGSGLHAPAETGRQIGRQKREGDGCAPAGAFAITALFGEVADDSPLLAGAMPFFRTTPTLLAIDDPASACYNRIVDRRDIECPDWASAEAMQRADGRYALGAVVAHNGPPARPGGGSCIFIHIAEAGQSTAGCTALPSVAMLRLAGWLRAAAWPVLVQLPQAVYDARQPAWGLPPLPLDGADC